jgi:hypothetical protein
VRRLLLVLAIAGVAIGLGAASGGARTAGVVPSRLVGAFDTYLPTKNPTKRGHWILLIGRHGSFFFTTPLVTLLKAGPVSVNGSTLTLPPDVARGGTCMGPGIYSWSRKGEVLSFSRVEDACAARVRILTTREWRHFTSFAPVIIIQG